MSSKKTGQTNPEGYLYILPAFLVVLVFGIWPILYTVYVSLHRWRIKQGDFIFLDNFQTIFGEGPWLILLVISIILLALGLMSRDKGLERFKNQSSLLARNKFVMMSGRERLYYGLSVLAFCAAAVLAIISLPYLKENGDSRMWDSLRVTIWYSLGAVPIQLAGGLFIAWFLNNKFRGRQVYRVLFLLPYIVPTVAGAAVFRQLFSLRPESFANQVIMSIGAEPQEWLREVRGLFDMLFGLGTGEPTGIIAAYWNEWLQGPSLALVSILFFNYWVFTGYYGLIYANGLSQIPKELYEAAEVDGASRWTVFTKIVLPLLTPTTYFLTLLGIIGTFKSFSHIWVLRNDFTRGAADPLSIYIFNVFYSRSRFGLASAMSLVLMAIVLLLTAMQNRMMKNRIHYGD